MIFMFMRMQYKFVELYMNSHWNADTQNPLKMYSSIFPFNETSDLHQNSLLLNIYRNEMSLVIPLQIHFIYHFVNQLAQMETHKLDLKKRDHRLFALFNHFIGNALRRYLQTKI